jgi:hypothetical protein
LHWDLLAMRPSEGDGPFAFCDFTRDEAAGLARKIQQDLEQRATAGSIAVETLLGPGGIFLIGWQAAGFRWVACFRVPGKPYEPAGFPTLEEASEAIAAIQRFLRPPADAPQELYFNTQNFSR